MHIADGSYKAVSAICTHLGCTVTFRSDAQLVNAPATAASFHSQDKFCAHHQQRR